MLPVKCASSDSYVPPPMGAVGDTFEDRGEGEAGQSNVETGCSTLTVKKHSDLKESECGINVQEKNRLIDSQRVEKREKDDLVEEPAHLKWREGYDRVLPEVKLSFERFSFI